MRTAILAGVAATLLLAATTLASPPHAPEKRCGWLDNPTPANWWLDDRAGEWELGVQGGRQAAGMDEMPDMSVLGTLPAGASHGYSCACITGLFDPETHDVLRVIHAEPKPLRLCAADRRLHRPE